MDGSGNNHPERGYPDPEKLMSHFLLWINISFGSLNLVYILELDGKTPVAEDIT